MVSGTISLVRGDDQTINLTVTQDDGTAYNLTDCIVTLTVRKNTYYDPDILVKTVTSHTDPTAGLTAISFIPADTADLDDHPYFCIIRLTNSVLQVTTLFAGTLTVLPF